MQNHLRMHADLTVVIVFQCKKLIRAIKHILSAIHMGTLDGSSSSCVQCCRAIQSRLGFWNIPTPQMFKNCPDMSGETSNLLSKNVCDPTTVWSTSWNDLDQHGLKENVSTADKGLKKKRRVMHATRLNVLRVPILEFPTMFREREECWRFRGKVSSEASRWSN